jgi:hypothetical protein
MVAILGHADLRARRNASHWWRRRRLRPQVLLSVVGVPLRQEGEGGGAFSAAVTAARVGGRTMLAVPMAETADAIPGVTDGISRGCAAGVARLRLPGANGGAVREISLERGEGDIHRGVCPF